MKQEYLQQVEDDFPNAELLGNPTQYYNCHSYAWYNQSTTNRYWINDPSAYYTDGSYVEVETPTFGDVVGYFYQNYLLHSGIITNYSDDLISNDICENVNLYQVSSKWGKMGLYSHKGDECPYTTFYDNGDPMKADNIKYFHHNHFTTYSHYDLTYHYKNICCSEPILELHNWREARIPQDSSSVVRYVTVWKCTKCGEEVPYDPTI